MKYPFLIILLTIALICPMAAQVLREPGSKIDIINGGVMNDND